MARPQKWRRICCMPRNTTFGPLNAEKQPSLSITMSVDEYECIRLIDLEGLTQEECAVRMSVARTTTQAIYSAARKKLADALVNGCELRVEGGSFRLCGGDNEGCRCQCCKRKFALQRP